MGMLYTRSGVVGEEQEQHQVVLLPHGEVRFLCEVDFYIRTLRSSCEK